MEARSRPTASGSPSGAPTTRPGSSRSRTARRRSASISTRIGSSPRPFSLDGKHLITLGRDGSIKLIEAATGSFIDDIGKNYGELKVLARNPKSDQLVIGGDERVPRTYKVFRTQARDMNYTDFNLLKAFEPMPGAPISAVAYSPDGSRIAVGGSVGEVRIYDAANGTRKATLGGIKGNVFAIAFAPDGSRVAVGGFDGTVRLYDAADGSLVHSFVPVPIQGQNIAATR